MKLIDCIIYVRIHKLQDSGEFLFTLLATLKQETFPLDQFTYGEGEVRRCMQCFGEHETVRVNATDKLTLYAYQLQNDDTLQMALSDNGHRFNDNRIQIYCPRCTRVTYAATTPNTFTSVPRLLIIIYVWYICNYCVCFSE